MQSFDVAEDGGDEEDVVDLDAFVEAGVTEQDMARARGKTLCMALSLLGAGLALLVVSIAFMVKGKEGGLPFLIISVIALLPGVYGTVNFYGARRGWRGFSEQQLPNYDEL